MNDDVPVSIRQMDGAWRLMCADGPNPAVAATEGIQFIFSGLPLSFFNLSMLTESDISGDTLGARAREACAWAVDRSVPWFPGHARTARARRRRRRDTGCVRPLGRDAADRNGDGSDRR